MSMDVPESYKLVGVMQLVGGALNVLIALVQMVVYTIAGYGLGAICCCYLWIPLGIGAAQCYWGFRAQQGIPDDKQIILAGAGIFSAVTGLFLCCGGVAPMGASIYAIYLLTQPELKDWLTQADAASRVQ